jgi:hypothetical protein
MDWIVNHGQSSSNENHSLTSRAVLTCTKENLKKSLQSSSPRNAKTEINFKPQIASQPADSIANLLCYLINDSDVSLK